MNNLISNNNIVISEACINGNHISLNMSIVNYEVSYNIKFNGEVDLKCYKYETAAREFEEYINDKN